MLIRLSLMLYGSRALAELGARVGWPLWSILGGLAGLGLGYGLGRLAVGRAIRPGEAIAVLPLWVSILYPSLDLRVTVWAGLIALLAALMIRFPQPKPRVMDGTIFVGALAVYWLTLARGLLPADAGEFQLVAARLGVAHPPGYPLYTLLGWLFTHLMPHNPMRGLNLFSAFTTALAVSLAGRTARHLSRQAWAGLVAASALAFAPSVWSTATQASIRPLTIFFTALCLERLTAPQGGPSRSLVSDPAWGFMLAFGLGLTHHPSLVFPGLFFGLYWLAGEIGQLRQRGGRLPIRRWIGLAGAFALGFVPWLYLPLRGAMGAVLAPKGLATWEGFWDHVLARGFAGDLFAFGTPLELLDRLQAWANILSLQWSAIILGGMVLAVLILAWRDRLALTVLLGGSLLHSLVTMSYRAPQTVEYLAPAYVLLAILLGAGVGHLMRLPKSGRARELAPILAAVMIVAGLSNLARNRPSLAALAEDDSTRAYAEAVFEQAPPNAVVLSVWHWAMPMQALRQIEGRRPDVEVIYVYPQGAEPLAETWARRIGEYIGQRPVIVTGFFPAEYKQLPYFFEPLAGGAWLVRPSPRRDLPPDLTALTHPLAFDNGLALIGIALPPAGSLRVGETFEVRLAWRVERKIEGNVTAYVHLTRADGLFISGSDRHLPVARAEAGDVLVDRYVLGVPPYVLPSAGGDYLLTAGLYTSGPEGVIEEIAYARRFYNPTIAADFPVEPARWPAPTAHPRQVIFAGGGRLTGVDWEGQTLYLHGLQSDGTPRTIRADRGSAQAVIAEQLADHGPCLGPWALPWGREVPIPEVRPGERYVALGQDMLLTHVRVKPEGNLRPGQTVMVDLTLLSARPLLVDDVIKVDLIGAGYAWRAQSDHIPANGALPTLKWLWGWRIWDRHRLTVPEHTDQLAAHAELVVYDHFSGERLPLLDHELAGEGIAVLLYSWGGR